MVLLDKWGEDKTMRIGGKFSQDGSTLIELMMVLGIAALLFGFIGFSLFRAQHSSSLNATALKLTADFKSQQIKAMTGDTEGRAVADNYGIYFESNRYILFHGSSYTIDDPTNFVIPLDQSLEFTGTTLPSSTIIFSKGSGEMVGFVEGSNTLTLENTQTSQQKTFIFNKYGVITDIN